MDFCTKLLNIEDRRTQRLHDLASDGGFVALKRAAEDRGTEKQKKDVKNQLSSRRLLLKDDGGGGDNWNYKTCKTAVKTSSATIQHLVFSGWMPFLSPNQPCQSTAGIEDVY